MLVLLPVHDLLLNLFAMNPRTLGPILPVTASERRKVPNAVQTFAPETLLLRVIWVAVVQLSGDSFLFIIEQLLFTQKFV